MDSGARRSVIVFWSVLIIPISFILVLGLGQCSKAQSLPYNNLKTEEYVVSPYTFYTSPEAATRAPTPSMSGAFTSGDGTSTGTYTQGESVYKFGEYFIFGDRKSCLRVGESWICN